MKNKYQVGDKVSDGFEWGVVIKVDRRQAGKPIYLIDWKATASEGWVEESFLERVKE